MRGASLLLAGALLAGCGDNHRPSTDDAAPTIDAAPTADATPDATPAAGPCLDRPGDLPRPPIGQLPCELLPPGFGT